MDFADTLCSLTQPYDIQEGSLVSRHVFANTSIDASTLLTTFIFELNLTLRITVCRL